MLADGDVVRSGQFAISNSPSAHLSKFTFGPSIEGLFLQSNLGIVTKLGIWLHPQPQAYMSCSWDMPNFEDVELIVEIFGALRRDGLLPNTVYVSNIVEWLGMTGKRAELWPEEGPIPDWRLKELQKELNLGYWNIKFGLYGAKEVVQAHFNELRRIISKEAPASASRLQGHIFSGENDALLEATSIPDPHGGFFVGVPSLWSLPMVKYRLPKDRVGIGAHADYSPIIPSSGKAVLEWVTTARAICEAQNFDLFCDFFMHERHVIFVNMMVFDKTDPKHRHAVDTIFRNLYKEGRQRGFSKYRSHINYMGELMCLCRQSPDLANGVDLVADSYDFNDHAYRRFVERLKVWYPTCGSTSADSNNRIRLIRKVFYHQGSRESGLQNIGSSVSACSAMTWAGAPSCCELLTCMDCSSLRKEFSGVNTFSCSSHLLIFTSIPHCRIR